MWNKASLRTPHPYIMCRVSTHMRLHVLTLNPPTVIPSEYHLTRDEGLVPLTGLGEHHSALLLSDCCSLLLWHCGAVHCQCGSPPGCLCSRGERHSSGYHSYICARTVPSSSRASVSNIIIHVHVYMLQIIMYYCSLVSSIPCTVFPPFLF